VPEAVLRAREIEALLTMKAGVTTVDDAKEVIDIASSDEDNTPSLKKTKIVKAYRVDPPLDLPLKPVRATGAAAATAALANVASLFNPVKLQEREEQHFQQSVQLTQFAGLQAEVREARERIEVERRDARMQIDRLQERLAAETLRATAETRRADLAESSLMMYKALNKRRRRDPSDDYQSRHRRRRSSPSSRGSDFDVPIAAPIPSGSFSESGAFSEGASIPPASSPISSRSGATSPPLSP
jgi:hypothetical protein